MSYEENEVSRLLKVVKESVKNNEKVYLTDSDLKSVYNIKICDIFFMVTINRVIEGKEMSFVSIKAIELKESFRGKGIFNNLINLIEEQNVNIMIDEIINHRLFSYLYNKGYRPLKYKDYHGWIRSMYKINNKN